MHPSDLPSEFHPSGERCFGLPSLTPQPVASLLCSLVSLVWLAGSVKSGGCMFTYFALADGCSWNTTRTYLQSHVGCDPWRLGVPGTSTHLGTKHHPFVTPGSYFHCYCLFNIMCLDISSLDHVFKTFLLYNFVELLVTGPTSRMPCCSCAPGTTRIRSRACHQQSPRRWACLHHFVVRIHLHHQTLQFCIYTRI